MATPTANQYAGTTPVSYTNTGPTPAFLPQTPGFVRGLRSLTDQYNSTLANIGAQRSQIGSQYRQQYSRMGTDVSQARRSLGNSMAARGMYNSSARAELDRADIQTPYGRNLQDMNQWANDSYGQLAQAQQGAMLGYNQGIADLLLQRTSDAVNYMPYALPQTGPQDRTYQMYDYWFDPNNITAPYGSTSAFADGSGTTTTTRRTRRTTG